jgi:hypothetical protein
VPRVKKLLRHARNVAALFGVDGFRSRLQRQALVVTIHFSVRFYLHQRQNRIVVSHHIDLTLQAGRGEIARDQHISLAAQTPLGISLAAQACARCTLLRRASAFHSGIGCVWRAQPLASAETNDRENQSRKHKNRHFDLRRACFVRGVYIAEDTKVAQPIFKNKIYLEIKAPSEARIRAALPNWNPLHRSFKFRQAIIHRTNCKLRLFLVDKQRGAEP